MRAQTGDFIIRDFAFDAGGTLPALRLHYRTLGRAVRDGRGRVQNAVLILHGTTGSGAQFLRSSFAGELFQTGQPLDAARHYIILPDGIGHGASSRPSDGLRMGFPRYGYGDMVRAQHRLLCEGLGVEHLRLVLGTSMGGMQTWLWGARHPRFMDGLVPLASLPAEIAGRNRMIRKMIIDSIRSDRAWNAGNYREQPPGLVHALHLLLMMTSCPLQYQQDAPTRAAADAWLAQRLEQSAAGMDANDMIYQFAASEDYRPAAELHKIRAPLLAINSADDQVNPPELGIMEAAMPLLERGTYILLPIDGRTRGHGTHTLAAVWKNHLAEFLRAI